MQVDRITPFFTDKVIFITGGTGFVGKVLIEKLLRKLSHIREIYLLVRFKKGKDSKQRLLELFNNPLFDKAKAEKGLDFLIKKCRVIEGDVEKLDLGISPADREAIIDNVHFIYHCAATIRFDESLKKAVLLNTRGTKLMLQLAKECKRLEFFGYMSTAYCHLNEKLLLEKPYPPPADPHMIIAAVERLDENVVESLTEKILGEIPNTYSYSKALAEALVVEAMDEIPAVIWRPSLIIPIWLEPLPGWTDNLNGPAGLLIGAGKGVIRTMYCKSTVYIDYLPVDVAVNGILVTTWNYVENKDHTYRVIHMVTSAELKVSNKEVIEIGREIIKDKVPLNGIFWYMGGSIKSNRLYHNICMILYHFIPAIVIDVLLFCLGYKPVLCRVHRRILKGFEVFEYYTNNQWDFDNACIMHIRSITNDYEKIVYKIDGTGVDIKNYFENFIRAGKMYLLKEYDDTLPAARRHMKIMWWVDKTCKTLIVTSFFYYVGKLLLRLLMPDIFIQFNSNH